MKVWGPEFLSEICTGARLRQKTGASTAMPTLVNMVQADPPGCADLWAVQSAVDAF